MKILISSAYPLASPKGNSITAKRIVAILEKVGLTAEAIHTDMPDEADVMIALHATKTLTCSKRFKVLNPNSQLIIYLTGTDLYNDQPNKNPDFFDALNLADKLVVSQQASLQSVPEHYKHKCHYVPASALLPVENRVPEPPPHSFVLASHLRPVKNPFLANRAFAELTDSNIHLFSLGTALDPTMVAEAQKWQQRDQRFQWLDNVPYEQTLSWMRQCTCTLNTSHSEGGSNAVAESIALGTPVLASRIEGNVGLLGKDYLGLFEPDSPTELARLLRLSIENNTFLQELLEQTSQLKQRFDPQKETEGWLQLFKKPKA